MFDGADFSNVIHGVLLLLDADVVIYRPIPAGMIPLNLVVLCATITLAAEEAPARDVLKLLFCHPLIMTAGVDESSRLIQD